MAIPFPAMSLPSHSASRAPPIEKRDRFELAASTIPIGDAIIVLRSNGPKATVYGVHGATAVVLLATAALLFT